MDCFGLAAGVGRCHPEGGSTQRRISAPPAAGELRRSAGVGGFRACAERMEANPRLGSGLLGEPPLRTMLQASEYGTARLPFRGAWGSGSGLFAISARSEARETDTDAAVCPIR